MRIFHAVSEARGLIFDPRQSEALSLCRQPARHASLHAGDTAIAMHGKKYAVSAPPDQVGRHHQIDVFDRSAGTWKLKVSRSSPQQKTESWARPYSTLDLDFTHLLSGSIAGLEVGHR